MPERFVVAVAGFVLVAAGCLGADSVDCPGGGVCPQGLVCKLDHGEQICALSTCGNGILESGESCDDGNNDSGDLCPGDCVALPTCGNGEREFGEECDDGNQASGDGCQATCLLPVRPLARSASAIAYDSTRGVLVVFGGRKDGARFGDTWEWNGVDWIERVPATQSPVGRWGAAVTFDSARDRIVMFGGVGAGVPLADTWEWDGVAWSERTVATPPPGGASKMTFDSRRGVSVLVSSNGETWEWDGSAWTPHTQLPGVLTFAPLLAYDETEGATLLVDPMTSFAWHWDGTTWSMLQTTTFPSALVGAMVYDRARRRAVVVAAPGDATLTWELDGTTWIERTDDSSAPPREDAALVYDDTDGVTVRFGGFYDDGLARFHDDTWAWDGTTWRELQ
jgi:cysteine-rich repeat protein